MQSNTTPVTQGTIWESDKKGFVVSLYFRNAVSLFLEDFKGHLVSLCVSLCAIV